MDFEVRNLADYKTEELNLLYELVLFGKTSRQLHGEPLTDDEKDIYDQWCYRITHAIKESKQK